MIRTEVTLTDEEAAAISRGEIASVSRSAILGSMSTKQETLAWLAELPDESPVWRELHDDARLLRDIAAAENDVRSGRERPLFEARTQLEAKWAKRHSVSF